MPIIEVRLMEGRSVAQKRSLIAAVTAAAVDTLGVAPESVRVLIDELSPEHFAVGGISAGELPLAARRNSHAAPLPAKAEL